MDIFGRNESNTFNDGITTDKVESLDTTAEIELGNSTIDLVATTVLINGNQIGGVTNPLNGVLDCAGNNIINVGQFNTNMNNFILATEESSSIQQGDIGALQSKTQLLFSDGASSTFSGNTFVLENFEVAKNTTVRGNLILAGDDFGLAGDPNAIFLLGPTGRFTIQKQNGLDMDLVMDVLDLTKINFYLPIDMQNEPINKVTKINNLTPVGGVYSGISDGVLILGDTTGSLLPLTGVGSLTIPANTFKAGDSYHLVCSGDIPEESKNDTLTVVLSANGLTIGAIVLSMENSVGVSYFELEADFTIRGVGVSAGLLSSFDFTFNKGAVDGFSGTRNVMLASINTSVQNTLGLNCTISGATTRLQTRLFYLRKQY